MTVEQNLVVSRAGSGDGPGVFWTDLWHSLRNPEFWALSSWLEILVRARRSRLGVLWLLVPALVYVFGFGSFFASLHGKTIPQFAAHVALGAMVFRTVMSSVIGSAGIFNANQSFILDGRVRLTDYLLETLAKASFDLCAYLPITAAALSLYGWGSLSWQGLLFAPLALVLIYLGALWISVVFSLVGARFPDFGQLLGHASIFLFLLTPIIWYAESMPAESIRGQLMRFNPFFHYVSMFRNPIMGIPVEPATWWYVGISTVAGLLLAGILYRRYARFVPLWI
ncbi:MAG: ABC transporter permease [Pseudoxanthomonas sp.]